MSRIIVAVATLAVVVGGCAATPDPRSTSPRTASDAPAHSPRAVDTSLALSPTPSASAEVTRPAPDEEWPIAGEERAVWYVRDFNGRQVILAVEIGGDRTCGRFSRVEVDESAQSIEIRAYVGYSEFALAGGACGLARLVHEERVLLEAFLDGRPLTGCLLGELPGDLRTSCSDITDDG